MVFAMSQSTVTLIFVCLFRETGFMTAPSFASSSWVSIIRKANSVKFLSPVSVSYLPSHASLAKPRWVFLHYRTLPPRLWTLCTDLFYLWLKGKVEAAMVPTAYLLSRSFSTEKYLGGEAKCDMSAASCCSFMLFIHFFALLSSSSRKFLYKGSLIDLSYSRIANSSNIVIWCVLY